MKTTPTTGGDGVAEQLPIVAWSYIPSDAWRDRVLTDDAEKVEIALGFGREITALTPHAPAQSALDDLRREVEALRAAAGQASFCLRELLPNDPDAQMTVRMLDTARASTDEGVGK